MNRLAQFGTLLAGLIVILILGFFRTGDRPSERPRRARTERRESAPEEAVVAPAAAAPPRASTSSIEAILALSASSERPEGVLTGPTRAEGPPQTPDGLLELGLTGSQRAIVEALIAERDARHREIRQEVEARLPKGTDADRLCADATRAQERCMSSIRETLLPDQRGRFDALLKSGRWGSYTLIIPK
jgi:hypothetical protein